LNLPLDWAQVQLSGPPLLGEAQTDFDLLDSPLILEKEAQDLPSIRMCPTFSGLAANFGMNMSKCQNGG
jgi:hypothetical protein